MIDFDLYFITDRNLTKKTIIEDVKAAVKADVKVIQYRDKDVSTKEMLETAKKIKEICQNKALFLINDRVDIALAINADGVHLGIEDMPYNEARKLLKKKIIGLTVHNVEEALEAEKLGADYISVSPIFHTTTKKDAGKPAGIKLIEDIKNKVKIPVVAIGGINLENMEKCLKAGADSVAMISAIVTKENVEEECRKIRDVILKYK